MSNDLEKSYEACEECTMQRNFMPQKSNKINIGSFFKNFYPNQHVQIDFAERGADNFLVMCDIMSGFFQIYKVKNKSAEQAILKVREWSSFWADHSRSLRTADQDSGIPLKRRPASSASL